MTTTGARPRGLIIAAPSSGSGKTVVTLGLLRTLATGGTKVAPAKAGPDYIDPGFHELASGHGAINLDPWAMSRERLTRLAVGHAGDAELLVVEAAMGLFDGAADGTGSAADLSSMLGLPVVLVIDVTGLSHSVAALARGFRDHRTDVQIAGVILNRVASDRHDTMLRGAMEKIAMPVFASVYRNQKLVLPERHLGLVQAREIDGFAQFADNAGEAVAAHLERDLLLHAAPPITPVTVGGASGSPTSIPPPGQRIAIARDAAFSFIYRHQLADWREQGAELVFFSPLADETPADDCDAVLLPGGYPELHAGKLATCARFKAAVTRLAAAGVLIHGECGGYMVLGEALVDANGKAHAMLGLLPLATSFREPKLHLGYRIAEPCNKDRWPGPVTAHEFHYATIIKDGAGEPLFDVRDAFGADLGTAGMAVGSVSGAFVHAIDPYFR